MSRNLTTRLGIALGLLSASVIACQLVLMQILAITQWHHFAYMVISVAMLGFGAAGTFISLFKNRLLKHRNILLPVFAIASGLAIELALRLTNSEWLNFDLYHLFIDPAQFWILAIHLLIYFLPFFFAALVIGVFFSAWTSDIGKLYFSNLVGSGIGGLLSLVILSVMFPWHALSFCAFFAMVSGLLMIRDEKPLTIVLLTAVVIAGSVAGWLFPYEVKPSQYKSLSKTLNMPDTEILYQRPGIHGLNQVVSSPFLRYAPGVSLSYTGDIPVKKAVFTNGEFTGVLTKNWNRLLHPASYTTFSLPFVLTPADTVLVLHAGTGYFVAQALRNGSKHIDATESNRTLVSLMKDVLLHLTDSIYHRPDVTVHTIEARTFLASTDQKYDMIILPVLDAFGGTSGLHAMQENYTLTTEGFQQAWNRLKPQGFISISSWLDYPVRTPLKLATSLVEMLKRYDIQNPEQHIALIKSWGTITFVVSKSPLSEHQVETTRNFCDSLFFDPVLLPGIMDEERNRYNTFGDPDFFTMLDGILEGSKDYDEYAFHIEPASDNRPYFNQFVRFRSFSLLSDLYNQEELPFLELGYLIVFVTLIQISVLALLLILIPLIRIKTQSGGKLPVLVYFASLGLGYMFIEIILIQRFILYFGTPVIAVAFVIAIMMISSGAGSFVSGYVNLSRRNLRIILAAVVAGGVILLACLNPILRHTIGMHLAVKVLIAVFMIAIPGFFMGMPFPLGLRATSARHQSLVPWAWGINGCLSVIASPLAILIAVEAGFVWVMLVAIIVYTLATGISGKLVKVPGVLR